MDLRNKRILVFSPYGATKHYGQAIVRELRQRGAEVFEYDERPSQNSLMKIVIRLFKNNVPQIFNTYCKRIIKKHQNQKFDYILICRGEAFTPQSILLFREAFPDVKIILYFWDILRCADLRKNIPYADRAFSFDPDDVNNNEGLIFRPTFFVPDYKQSSPHTTKENDIVFIGTLHSDRHKIIKEFETSFSMSGFRLFSYLYVPSIFVFIKDSIIKFPYIRLNKVKFNPISVKDTIKILEKSKAILDINYTDQKSLSTRAFEAMASKVKYITTNPEVRTYDFYNPNNILVVEQNNAFIPNLFLDTPFEPVPNEIMNKYSVSGLVDDLFS